MGSKGHEPVAGLDFAPNRFHGPGAAPALWRQGDRGGGLRFCRAQGGWAGALGLWVFGNWGLRSIWDPSMLHQKSANSLSFGGNLRNLGVLWPKRFPAHMALNLNMAPPTLTS